MNRLPIVAAIGGFLIGVLLISMAAICPPLHAASAGKTRTYYIAAIIVTAAGAGKADGSPAGVDREFVTLFNIFDENQSWYLDHNIAELPEKRTALDRRMQASSNPTTSTRSMGTSLAACRCRR
jgi:hypothetical protein